MKRWKMDTEGNKSAYFLRDTTSEGRIGITFGNLRLTNSYCNWSYGIKINFEI